MASKKNNRKKGPTKRQRERARREAYKPNTLAFEPRIGRPPIPVNPEMAEAVIKWLSDGGNLWAFAEKHDVAVSSIYEWRDKDEEFAGRFARARKSGADAKFELAEHIARTPMPGEITTVESGPDGRKTRVVREDMLGHRKLASESLMKVCATLAPSEYGQKQLHKHEGRMTLEQLIVESLKVDQEGKENPPCNNDNQGSKTPSSD
jgi:hypothetical protein